MGVLATGVSSVAVALEAEPAPTAEVAGEAHEPAPSPSLRDEVAALRDDIGAMWLQLDQLSSGESAPQWATAEHERLDRRIERMTALLERLAARVETPVPRLDEPLTLLTVSLCTLVLGFVAGRSLQRRGSRKDSRFRL